MTDREKVMKWLSLCKWSNAGLYEGFMPEYEVCNKCPYVRDDFEVDECCAELMRDALKLLKEQESVEAKTMGESKSHWAWGFACGACGHAIDPEDNFCRECGRKVK